MKKLEFAFFCIGLISLILGVRHYDFFGFTWKSLFLIIVGTIILFISAYFNPSNAQKTEETTKEIK